MVHNIELLAPGGDVDSIKAAIAAGADAVYCGLNKFNARGRATNISFDDLHGVLRLAHIHNCELFVTINVLILETEIPGLVGLLNKLINTGVDGVIVQDFGMLYLVSKYFPTLTIHASTQLTTHNEGQIKCLKALLVTRVNLCRELNLNEVESLTANAHQSEIATEVFVHGSNCISFSGLCYMSSAQGGQSGNRGRCSQPCRDQFVVTNAGKKYPLNLKDNSAFSNLDQLVAIGVDSLKIEGRIKKFDYVYTVVKSWRTHLDNYDKKVALATHDPILNKVFNRSLTNGFLTGDLGSTLFIDNPRDNASRHLAHAEGKCTGEGIDHARQSINHFRAEIMNEAQTKISSLSVEKVPLGVQISGAEGTPLTVLLKSLDEKFEFVSESNLRKTDSKGLDYETLFARLKIINDTAFYIDDWNQDKLGHNLSIPFKELGTIKKQVLLCLNQGRDTIGPVTLPKLSQNNQKTQHTLSVLISSLADLYLCKETTADLYFQLPDSIGDRLAEFVEMFRTNPKLTPWFPSVLIGEDYKKAVQLLHQLKPQKVVTNNSGIAYEAWKNGTDWIAGPYFNTTNSYSLLCLQEKFNCAGAFLSNELNKKQLRGIKKPANFKLFYSVCHPILLMTSRACLFQQVTGCRKEKMNEHCLSDCQKITSISKVNGETLLLQKDKGGYNRIFAQKQFLNTKIVADIPNHFDSFFIDLRETAGVQIQKSELINVFQKLISGNSSAANEIQQMYPETTEKQYEKGIC